MFQLQIAQHQSHHHLFPQKYTSELYNDEMIQTRVVKLQSTGQIRTIICFCK